MKSQYDNATRRPILGCIADDVTGATDLAINLVQGGMGVVQVLGVPAVDELSSMDADAIVVALKTRSIQSNQAIGQSLQSLDALRKVGVERYFFKYCSTFDSTDSGNIGPVAEAMMDELDIDQTIFCPAFPRNGRTVYQGHLFVNGCLLNESGMERHPLNPMTDANLVRFLSKQTNRKVGLLPYDTYTDESDGLRARLHRLSAEKVGMVVVDACDDEHLTQLASAVAAMRLVTGGSGIARYLPAAYRQLGLLNTSPYQPTLPHVDGRSLILAGSCSIATNRQVAWMKSRCPSWQINVPAIVADPRAALADVVKWAESTPPDQPVQVYSTCSVDEVQQLQTKFGADDTAKAIEDFIASVACALVSEHAMRRLVLAGGETSGAVVQKLGIRCLRIGPAICPGVPWTESVGSDSLALVLKSGNFGGEDFFAAALEMLP